MSIRILRRILSLICWAFIALLLFIMYGLSGQSAEQSNGLSLLITSLIARIINPAFLDMTASQQALIIQYLHPIVRKLAHFAEFALLGGLIMCAALCHMWSLSARVTVALLCSGLCAGMDEIHQLFVSGRSGQWRDVAIDFAGAILGIICILTVRALIVSVYRSIQEKNHRARLNR